MRDVFRSFFLFAILNSCLLIPAQSLAVGVNQQTTQAELFEDLMHWAMKLSGLPSTPSLPSISPLSSEQLIQMVCPEDPLNCRSLISFYSTDERAVFYLESLNMDDDTDLSFIVHELVHHLQYAIEGAQLFSTCQKVMVAESQAYVVQNKYLAQFKQWRRVGEALRYIDCDTPDIGANSASAITKP
jgi:hypothetical protein